MTGKEFAAQVDRDMLALYERGFGQTWAPDRAPEPILVRAMNRARLRLGVYNKRMITKALGRWIPCVEGHLTTLLLQQAQQENQHRFLYQARLRDLGVEPSGLEPPASWWWLWQGVMHPAGEEDVLAYSAMIHSVVEAWAALYSGEAFNEILEPVDPDTFALYHRKVLPDERFHHEVGQQILGLLADTGARQARVERALVRAEFLYRHIQADNQLLVQQELVALTAQSR